MFAYHSIRHERAARPCLELGRAIGLASIVWFTSAGLGVADDGTDVRFHTARGPASASDEFGAMEPAPDMRIEWGQPATAVGPAMQLNSATFAPRAVSLPSVTTKIAPVPIVNPDISLVMPESISQTSLAMVVPTAMEESKVAPALPPSVVTTYQAELPSILVARRMQPDGQSPSNRQATTMGWQPKPYDMMGVATELPGGQLPRDYAAQRMAEELPGPAMASSERGWAIMDYDWVATAFCHRPLYFEEPNLERYGYGCAWCLQPAASAAHFFGRVPALPYMMAADCPRECVYTLGHYRPGSPVPWRRMSVPKRLRAAFAEGGVWTGLIFLIP